VPSEPREPPNAATAPSDAQREPGENDDAEIRRVVATYARAIEGKDIALFRSVKPNLTSAEQRRLEDGFRAVSKQAVNITILSINRKGQDAVVTLRRRDTIQAGGRQQQSESQQMLTLNRNTNGWHIVEIR
jgi:ketosteroid isomerase-like protein